MNSSVCLAEASVLEILVLRNNYFMCKVTLFYSTMTFKCAIPVRVIHLFLLSMLGSCVLVCLCSMSFYCDFFLYL